MASFILNKQLEDLVEEVERMVIIVLEEAVEGGTQEVLAPNQVAIRVVVEALSTPALIR